MSARTELRQNVLTGRWVAVSPSRGERPHQTDGSQPPVAATSWDPSCPFCPGNESELPRVLAERPSPDGGGWSMRVVPNRYPAFAPEGDGPSARGEPEPVADGGLARSLTLGSDVPVEPARARSATGVQEVIIESPLHDRDPSRMSPDELEAVVDAYHERFRMVAEQEGISRVFLFRNHGRDAGTSLLHPHAQIVGTTVIPPEVRVREIRMMAYHNDHSRCLLCDLPDLDTGWDERVVLEDPHFTVVVPWAAEAPFEVWLAPVRHQACFGEAEADERRALARILGELLRRYRTSIGDPHYNLLIHSGPASRAGSGALHWFLQIRPRLTRAAGFELAAGIHLNPSLPEEDARTLREAGRRPAGDATPRVEPRVRSRAAL